MQAEAVAANMHSSWCLQKVVCYYPDFRKGLLAILQDKVFLVAGSQILLSARSKPIVAQSISQAPS